MENKAVQGDDNSRNLTVGGDFKVNGGTANINLGTINNYTLPDGQVCTLSYSDALPELRYFQGRTQQLEQLNSVLVDPKISIIGVRGDGGIGKSTLTAKAFLNCHGFKNRFWIDVRTQPAITDLAKRALLELGVPIAEVAAFEAKDQPQRLLRHLQTGRYLIAIDNLESLLTAEGQWQGGYGKFLEQFHDSSGESVLLLASREYPQKYYRWLRFYDLRLDQGLEPSEGVALLRGLEIQGSNEELEAASREVRGHPLALTLIAGWIRQEARKGERQVTLLERAGDYFQITGRHRGESGHSLESVLTWSMERLSPDPQHLLTQVSVLRGWFTVETAAAMITETMDVATALEDLERRSLVQEVAGPKYRLQPRLQDFAKRRTGNVSAVHKRAINYFWQRRVTDFTPGAPKEVAADYFEVFHHQVQLQQWQAAAQTIFACDVFLRLAGGYQALVDRYKLLHQQWQPTLEQRQTYSAIGINLGSAYVALGDYHPAISLYEQSLTIARAIGDRQGEAYSLNGLGNAYDSLGDYHRAIALYEQSLRIARAIGDRKGEAASLGGLGNAYNSLEKYHNALDFHKRSLKTKREIGDRKGEAASLGNLGGAYFSLGDYRSALDFHEQSLKIKRKIGDRKGEAASLSNLGLAYFSLGDYRSALDFHEQSLEIKCAIGDRRGEANACFNRALALAKVDQSLIARQSLEQARTLYVELQLTHRVEECDAEIRKLDQPLVSPLANNRWLIYVVLAVVVLVLILILQ